MQIFDGISGLHSCHKSSEPSTCLDEVAGNCKHGKSTLLLKSCSFLVQCSCYFVNGYICLFVHCFVFTYLPLSN